MNVFFGGATIPIKRASSRTRKPAVREQFVGVAEEEIDQIVRTNTAEIMV
jgi:hypothetical protein